MNRQLILMLLGYFVVFTGLMVFYLSGRPQGNFNAFFAPSSYFGVPQNIADRGIVPFIHPPEFGWDGQFYFYIANDLIGTPETIKHVDAAAYRYQRIGLPLVANFFSKILNLSWVPPWLFFATSLLFVAVAAILLATFLKEFGVSPSLTLFWLFAYGTLVTPMYGLPDAFADASLIIGLILWLRKPTGIGAWAACMFLAIAGLSREAYLLLILCLGLFELLRSWRKPLKLLPLSVAALIVLGWQFWIRHHFGLSPSSQAIGILDWPLRTSATLIWSAIKGEHPLFIHRKFGYIELPLLLGFNAMILFSIYSSFKLLRSESIAEWRGLALFTLMLSLLYLCFGGTVMNHHSGFLKAGSLFAVLLPLLWIRLGDQLRPLTRPWLLAAFLFLMIGLATYRALEFAYPGKAVI